MSKDSCILIRGYKEKTSIMENKPIELNDQEQARREKLPKYKDFGVEPFGQAYKVTHHVSDIRKLCEKKSDRALEKMNLVVSIAGRIMAIRRMGKASFVNIQDKTGNIQSFIGINIMMSLPKILESFNFFLEFLR